MRPLPCALFLLVLAAAAPAKNPDQPLLPEGAKLYLAPMEWNLDQFMSEEIRRHALRVTLVPRAEDAEFVMSSEYQSLGSHLMSPGHYIQVRIAAAGDGKQVWFAEANDYALLFGRLRPHGPQRVAGDVVRKLHRRLSPPTR